MPNSNRLAPILAITLTILIAALLLGSRSSSQPPLQHCTLAFSNGVTLRNIPLAITDQQQRRGLSNLDDIGPGMLFHYPQPKHLSFWMRNTRVPLSIGFFSADGTLLQIEGMQPNSDTSHISQQLATDALELPQGGFAKLGLEVGARLTQQVCE
jgi:hypothetical protein